MKGKMSHWFWLFLINLLCFIFLFAVMSPESIKAASLFLLLFTLGIILLASFLDKVKSREIKKNWHKLLRGEEHDLAKGRLLGPREQEQVLELEEALLQLKENLAQSEKQLEDYEEFIEAWVHEVKTPLFLLELYLSKHREEIQAKDQERLSHIYRQLSEDVEKILHYARLKADHVDLYFQAYSLNDLVENELSRYCPAFEDRGIHVQSDLGEYEVHTDKRIFSFILGQIFSNCLKYADPEEGKILIKAIQEGDDIRLEILNNGETVSPEDKPFLFDKGFTGNRPGRQKATGMGLYLVKKYTELLGVEVEIIEVDGHWSYGLCLRTPIVEK